MGGGLGLRLGKISHKWPCYYGIISTDKDLDILYRDYKTHSGIQLHKTELITFWQYFF